eukprot:365087-Chlamydomonas_euryale.AAC.8
MVLNSQNHSGRQPQVNIASGPPIHPSCKPSKLWLSSCTPACQAWSLLCCSPSARDALVYGHPYQPADLHITMDQSSKILHKTSLSNPVLRSHGVQSWWVPRR